MEKRFQKHSKKCPKIMLNSPKIRRRSQIQSQTSEIDSEVAGHEEHGVDLRDGVEGICHDAHLHQQPGRQDRHHRVAGAGDHGAEEETLGEGGNTLGQKNKLLACENSLSFNFTYVLDLISWSGEVLVGVYVPVKRLTVTTYLPNYLYFLGFERGKRRS